MKPNRMREVLSGGGVPVGHMISEFATRGIAKILEPTGVDFVVVDLEHTGHSMERVADLMAWFKAGPIAPFVRVPQPHYHFLARALDVGALGVMSPDVKTASEARSIVDAVKYAPLGKRGVGLGTAHNDYVAPPDSAAYFEEANRNTTVICQIESEEGVNNAGSIAGTEGVDVLWIGHNDLANALGVPGQFQSSPFREALAAVVAAARGHGKAVAAQPPGLELAQEWLGSGLNAISWGSDMALYQRCLKLEIANLRAMIGR